MATKTKAKAAGILERIAHFTPPADACGLGRVPRGLAASEQAAALLGLGFPNLLVLVDEPVAPMPDYATYKREYHARRIVPRALGPTMLAVVRAGPATEALDAAVRSPPVPPPVVASVEKALRFGGASVVPILEAVYGAAPVSDAIVGAIDAAKVGELNGGKYENYGYAIIYALGELLWRLPAKAADEHRATLRRVLARLHGDGELWRSGRALDVILNGRAGVERSGRNFNGDIFLAEYQWASDDPEWALKRALAKLERTASRDREQFTIQLAVVCGPKMLAALRAGTTRFQKDQQASIAEQLALCA